VMRERLRTALGEINQFTQKLETKVQERTEQLKAAQKKLVQSDRLASLGQLSASVAHEINNPVSGVLNLSMLMQRMLTDDGVPPARLVEFRRYLSQVINETSRVGHIVSDLLAFSRRGKPQRAPADLNRIVRMTLSLVQHKLKLSNVSVEADLNEGLPPVLCDPSQIQQVVLNLVLNAAEATQSKGVDKRPGRVSVTTFIADGMEMLTVADNGEGIPPENLAKIFDPFFTTKSEGKGVGWGWRYPTVSSRHTAAISKSKARREPAPPSPCRCRSSSRRRAVARRRRRWPERDEVFLRGRHAGSGPASAHGYRRAR